MSVAGVKIYNCARCLLFCTFFILAFKSAEGFWPRFWSFSDDNSITTPTLKFYPADPDTDREHILIYYKYNDTASSQKYIDSINTFLKDYTDKETPHKNSVSCDYGSLPPINKFCRFRSASLGRCSAERGDYGFVAGSPCFFLTLSREENWIPDTYKASDVEGIQENDTLSDMPLSLQYLILHMPPNRDIIWVTCKGRTPGDKEDAGPINFFPQHGFPTKYFPFKNVEGYQSPIVAIQLERPMYGVIISIECKLWAKNIKLDREIGIGYVKFSLMID